MKILQQEKLPPIALPVAFAPATDWEEQQANDALNLLLAIHIAHETIPDCHGQPDAKGICPDCFARTTATPHANHFDIPHYSSDSHLMAQLLAKVLQTWSQEDLRLLGFLMQGISSERLAFALLHVLQKASPQKLVVGSFTPWGSALAVTELQTGAFQVEAQAGQGVTLGLLVDALVAYRDLSPETRELGQPLADWFCFTGSEPVERMLTELRRKPQEAGEQE